MAVVPASLGALAVGAAAGVAADIAVGIAVGTAAGSAEGTAAGTVEIMQGTRLLVERMASPAVVQHQGTVAWLMAAGSKGPAA